MKLTRANEILESNEMLANKQNQNKAVGQTGTTASINPTIEQKLELNTINSKKILTYFNLNDMNLVRI